jgi:hypothetical protein
MTQQTPAAFVAQTADMLLISDPTPQDRATAELLNYIADTWNEHYISLRDHAVAVARAIDARLS